MVLPEAVKKARKDLRLSQKRLAELAGIQRKQLATLESGGNITLATLRKVLIHLPNLETFSLDAVSATVLRQVPPDQQVLAIKKAFNLLGDAIRDFVPKVNEGPEQDAAKRERELTAYRGGAAAAFASIVALAQRRKSRTRSKRAASET
jgi:predicted transcriptional regulator